jgi:hypothetical protein
VEQRRRHWKNNERKSVRRKVSKNWKRDYKRSARVVEEVGRRKESTRIVEEKRGRRKERKGTG